MKASRLKCSYKVRMIIFLVLYDNLNVQFVHVVVGLLLWLNSRVSRELGEAMVGFILHVLLVN